MGTPFHYINKTQWNAIQANEQCFRGCRFHNNEEAAMAVCELFLMQEPNFDRDRIFKLVPRWGHCLNVLGYYVEIQRYFSGINELHLTL
jgi:hypothetical protein